MANAGPPQTAVRWGIRASYSVSEYPFHRGVARRNPGVTL